MRRATFQEDALGAGTRLARVRGTAPRLRATDVEVWEIRLDDESDEAVARLRATLSPDEEERADSFYFERDRRRFVVGRGVLRVLLGRYVGCAPEDVVFRYGASGKPELAGDAAAGLHFNLAHTEGLALCAITRVGPVGVDVERVRELPDWQYIAATCFSPSERQRVDSAAPSERRLEFFRAWTRQEAALKATGVGLGGIPANGAGGAAPDGANPAFRAGASPLMRVYPLATDPDYAAALAVSPGARWLTWLRWDPEQARGQTRRASRSQRIRLEQSAQLNLHML